MDGSFAEFRVIARLVAQADEVDRMRAPEWIDMTSRLPDLIEGEIGFEMYHVTV